MADGSDWVSSGFSNNALPSSFQTEWDAYQVQGSISEGFGASEIHFPTTNRNYTIFLSTEALTNEDFFAFPFRVHRIVSHIFG